MALNITILALFLGLLGAAGGLLDSQPTDIDAARATALSVQDVKQRAALMHRQKALAKKQAIKRTERFAWSTP